NSRFRRLTIPLCPSRYAVRFLTHASPLPETADAEFCGARRSRSEAFETQLPIADPRRARPRDSIARSRRRSLALFGDLAKSWATIPGIVPRIADGVPGRRGHLPD